MESLGKKKKLKIIAKLHVKDKNTLYEHVPEAIRMGIDVFGGTVEEHPHQMQTPYERDIRIINRFRENIGMPVIAEVRPVEVMRGYNTRDKSGIPSIAEAEHLDDNMMGSILFKVHDRVDFFHLFPEIPRNYSMDGKKRIDDFIIDELNGLIKDGSKPVILEISSNYAVDEYSKIAQKLIKEGHDLRMSVGVHEKIEKVYFLADSHKKPVYMNLGNVNLLTPYLLQQTQQGLDLGATGVIVDVPIHGNGLEPLEKLITTLKENNSHTYKSFSTTN